MNEIYEILFRYELPILNHLIQKTEIETDVLRELVSDNLAATLDIEDLKAC